VPTLPQALRSAGGLFPFTALDATECR